MKLKSILRRIENKRSTPTPQWWYSDRSKSPPPELETIKNIKKKENKTFHVTGVPAKVDCAPPMLPDSRAVYRRLRDSSRRAMILKAENEALLTMIKMVHFSRGRVDSRWTVMPQPCMHYFDNRLAFHNRRHRENQLIYKRIVTQGPKVVPTAEHNRDWARNRRLIVQQAQGPFVLFQPIPQDLIEDSAFIRPKGVRRPRLFFALRTRDYAEIGELEVELFTDICPGTCRLFTELMMGDGVGHSYVGCKFFKKIPHLYWSGGDVIFDNGFGCYRQRARTCPIGAENYHFSHSMPGLLSMSVTCDNEVCGIFNMTFKHLQQLDLKNVIFGRIRRPSEVFDIITSFGAVLSTRPEVYISRTRMKRNGQWHYGVENTRVQREISPRAYKKIILQEQAMKNKLAKKSLHN